MEEGKKIHLKEGKIYFREGKKIYCMSKKRFEEGFLANKKKYPIYRNGVDISMSRVPEDDHELIEWWLAAKQRSSWGLSFEDESNRLEIYGVIVDDEKVIVEKCLELLKRIDRESQFIACSVEEPSLFYAELNKDDATRLKASDGIRVFRPRELIANFGMGD